MPYLEETSLLIREHSSSLSGAIESLKASTLRLPVVSGARVRISSMGHSIIVSIQDQYLIVKKWGYAKNSSIVIMVVILCLTGRFARSERCRRVSSRCDAGDGCFNVLLNVKGYFLPFIILHVHFAFSFLYFLFLILKILWSCFLPILIDNLNLQKHGWHIF